MSTRHANEERLPSGVGRIGPRWIAACVVLAGVIALGIYGYLQQRLHGDIVTGLRTIGQGGPAWGLYICFDVMFVGLAFGGISLTAVARLFRIRTLWPLARMAELMAVIALSMAGLCVIADLGRPVHGLLNLPKYARTVSPFFGTFTMVIGAGLSACLVYLFLDGRADAAWCAARAGKWSWFYRLFAAGYANTDAEHHRHRQAGFWLSFAVLPLMWIAYSTLGFVFGIQGGRPGWYGALQAPSFVVLAAISGLGLLLAIAGTARRWLTLENEIPAVAFRWLGNALGMLILVYLYLIAVEELTARYSAGGSGSKLAREIVSGDFAPLFWTMIACFVVPLAVLFERGVRRRDTPAAAVFAGLLVNVAAILERYLLVVPSQTHGQMLPWPTGSYAPSWVELSVVAGLLALGTLLYLVFLKIFPIVPLQSTGIADKASAAPESVGRMRLRRVAFVTTLTFGLALAVTAFALSARVGTLAYLDPIVPFSPVLFIIGVAIALSSPAVFELVPTARATHPRD